MPYLSWEKMRKYAYGKLNSYEFSGYCQRFVSYCYNAGGQPYTSQGTATQAYRAWGYNKSMNAPIGAAVYFGGSDPSVGHVGLSLGGNQIIHAWGRVRVDSYGKNNFGGFRGWGWNGGNSWKVSTLAGTIAGPAGAAGSPPGSNPSNPGNLPGIIGGGLGQELAKGQINGKPYQPGDVVIASGAPKKVQIFSAQDEQSIKKWGLLRYYEKINTPSDGKKRAEKTLQLYDRKTRYLTIRRAFGDLSVRQGCLIPVKLNLGDFIVNNYMLVNKVTHYFRHDTHFMDLELEGAWRQKYG